jgi:hypothetical protein
VLLAARSVDVPASDEIAHKKSTLDIQLRDEFDEALTHFEVEGNAGNPDEVMTKMDNYIDSLNEIRDTKLQSLANRLEEDRYNRQTVQEKLSFSLARLSPTTSLSLATSHLAGSSLRLKERFAQEAKAHQKTFGNFMKEKTGMNTGGLIKLRKSTSCGGGNDDDKEEQPEPINPQELPGANIASITLMESVEPALVDMGLLILYNFLFFAGSFVAFMRYDVR